jgi:hypothetical protein
VRDLLFALLMGIAIAAVLSFFGVHAPWSYIIAAAVGAATAFIPDRRR